MPAFNFTSGTGISLTERIAAINAKQNAMMGTIKREELAEDKLMEQVNNDPSVAPPIQEEEPVILSRVGRVDEVGDQIEDLKQVVIELTSEVKKINKHINSIVKTLKKA